VMQIKIQGLKNKVSKTQGLKMCLTQKKKKKKKNVHFQVPDFLVKSKFKTKGDDFGPLDLTNGQDFEI
jgi:hypothetical protein